MTPGTKETYRLTLERAAQILGGADSLSQQLGVSVSELNRWLAGEAVPPAGIFGMAVEVLIQYSKQAAPDKK